MANFQVFFFPERVKFVFCKMGRVSYGSGIFFLYSGEWAGAEYGQHCTGAQM